MIKYILPKNGRPLIKINTEDLNDIRENDYHRINIDWLWIVDEDGEFNGKQVNKGDIIISFYGMPGVDNSRETVIVKDEALKDYYARYDEAESEYQNKLNEKSQPCCDDCCNCCEKCAA